MRLLAPAKINLHLRVGRRREDGFHPLLSWMVTVGLFDTITLERAGAPGVAFRSDLDGLPQDEGNLVVRVAHAWEQVLRSPQQHEVVSSERASGRPGDTDGSPGLAATSAGGAGGRVGGAGLGAGDAASPEGMAHGTYDRAERATSGPGQVGGVRVMLEKRIPVGAGLGGGSSDAARTLLGLNRLDAAGGTDALLPATDLSALAVRFGSDVPFFLSGPSSVCRGRGEQVRPIAAPAARGALLLLPGFALSTAEVYRTFDAMDLGRDEYLADEPYWNAWARESSEKLLPALVNDLEPAAFALKPELGTLRAEVEQQLGRPVRMSGSGSSLFTLFDQRAQAQDAVAQVRRVASRLRLECDAKAVEVAPRIDDDLDKNFGDISTSTRNS